MVFQGGRYFASASKAISSFFSFSTVYTSLERFEALLRSGNRNKVFPSNDGESMEKSPTPSKGRTKSGQV